MNMPVALYRAFPIPIPSRDGLVIAVSASGTQCDNCVPLAGMAAAKQPHNQIESK